MPHNTPEKRRAWSKKYYRENHFRLNAHKLKWSRSVAGKAKKSQYYLSIRNDPIKYVAHLSKLSKLRQSNRKKMIEMYGGKCACCGEATFEFMAIDHVNGGGKQHRKSVASGAGYVGRLLREKRGGFRVLCHNCNMSLGFYGYCPHGGLK